jgi:hypothetical protein
MSVKTHVLPTLAALACAFALLVVPAGASTTTPAPGWSLGSAAEPTNFQSGDGSFDRYTLTAVNVGARATEGEIKVIDKLPSGLAGSAHLEEPNGPSGECAGTTEVTCTWGAFGESLPAGQELLIEIHLEPFPPSLAGLLVNEATVEGGGGGGAVTTTDSTPVNAGPASFGIDQYAFQSTGLDGTPDLQGGDHPYQVLTRLNLNTDLKPSFAGHDEYVPVQPPKDVSALLPLGFVGDPLATPRCSAVDVTNTVGSPGTGKLRTICPPASQVGVVHLVWENGHRPEPTTGYPLYNIVSATGYPAELAFNAGLGQPIFLYASVVPSPSGYRLRVASPGALNILGVEAVEVTVFGNPAERFGTGSGSAAFLTNPTSCSSEPLSAGLEASGWEGGSASAVTPAYPGGLTGCDKLQGAAAFSPSIKVKPETTQSDTPAGYEVDLKVPQAPSVFGALATPYLRDATVAFPQGVAVSPSSANGLAACAATGPEGINIEGPEATELGAGHPGGNSSAYDDGLTHAAPGHCPAASTLGTVEVTTPVLEKPLQGHIYLAAPDCSPCSDADAEDGKMIRLYMEIAGSGVIVKLPGFTTVNPATGQLSGIFEENPQLPFEELKVRFKSGPRAALVNPETCGAYTSTSDLKPWSAPESGPDATPTDSFQVNEGCAAPGFAPSFSAGTVNNQAGAYSPFTLSFSRQDTDQQLSGLSMTLPPGLLAKLAGVARCGEAEANAGTCPESSRIGTVTTGAGPGPDPYYVTGKVYLTGPYNGGPFGEVVEVPAVAGPFNLGMVVVRGSIRINPTTAQATVVSNPFPTILDGIPLQVKTVNVTLNREGFTFNPTNCTPQTLNATLTSTQGANANVSSPFEAANCAALPFKPSFTVGTQGKTSKADGASLTIKVASSAGQANIGKVSVELPKQLPARLTTLQKACTEAQFNTNPAGCPVASDIGTAKAVTPLLNVPLTGPVYLVSHGGAAFPDVEFILQGEGVEIVLDGKTQIKKGITYNHFETVPDAPISTFETTLPEGKFSVLATDIPAKAKNSLCGLALNMPTTLTGQNGAVVKQTTKISVTGCTKAKSPARAQKLAVALKACRNKGKGKRASCEKQARKQYGPAKKKAKSKKK